MDRTTRAEYALFLHVLADKADAIARHYFQQNLDVEQKADASPVTIADQEIEMALIEEIRRYYPEHGIFGEETQRINPDASLQWVIDPIDGTRAFIAGKPTFVTLVALCENDTPQLGIISQTIQKRRWLGGDGHAAEARSVANLSEARLATTSGDYFSEEENIIFQKIKSECKSTTLNIDGLAAGLLADGEVDLIIEAGLKPYDFAALVPVVEQAGGLITDWQGEPLNLSSGGHMLAATNKTLHSEALKLLNTPNA